MDRATQFAVACTREAVADSGLEPDSLDPHRIGVCLGSAVASATSLENEYLVMSDAGKDWLVDPGYLSPHMFDYLSPGVMPAEVAWEVGAEGPVTMVSDGCTSGLDSVGYAVQLIREGTVDTVVAGAADTPISPIVVACFDAIKATTPRNDDPEHASRPFDGSRSGFVLAEGAAMFVLEEYEAARSRGAHIYAEVGGYATRCNAYHMTGLKKDGREMAEAIRVALDEARLDSGVIDYVNAHVLLEPAVVQCLHLPCVEVLRPGVQVGQGRQVTQVGHVGQGRGAGAGHRGLRRSAGGPGMLSAAARRGLEYGSKPRHAVESAPPARAD